MNEFTCLNNGTKKSTRNLFQTILVSGFLVGALDILTALADYYIMTGKNPAAVLKFIASGVFGKSAFTGGGIMIALGFLFHFIIAFSFTILFFSLYPSLRFMSKNRMVTGVSYGVFIWVIMNLAVLPMSNTPPLNRTFFSVLKSILILVVMIGLPLSFIAFRFYSGSKKTEN